MGALTALPALDVKPPQPNDALGSFSKLMALRSMANQQQLQQQQIASQQQEQALRQQTINDQQLIMKHMADNPSDTFGDTAKALKGQISLPAYTNLIDTDSTISLKHSQATDAQLKSIDAAHSQLQGVYNNIKNLDPQTLAQQTPQIAAQINAIPGSAVKWNPNQPITPDALEQFGRMNRLQEAYLQQEQTKRKTQAETEEATQKGEEAKANAAKANMEMQFGISPQLQEARYRSILQKIAAGQPTTDDELAAAKAYELSQRKTTTQSDTLGVTSTNTSQPTGLEALRKGAVGGGPTVPAGGITPKAPSSETPQAATGSVKQSLVDLIGQYKADPATLSRLQVKHPDILAMVHQNYPDWDQTSYQAKNKLVQSYTSGPESRSINAISTALGHAGELGQAIDALNNSNGLNDLRALGNNLGVRVLGDDKVTAFNLIVHRLAPEITAAYVQGGGGEGERMANEKDFASSLSDTQLRHNLGETVKLLRSKIAAQEQQWNNTYMPTRPQDQFTTRFLTPGAKDTLTKYSPESVAPGSANSGAFTWDNMPTHKP